jgi:outer membrane lipoprotein-sorting protein
MAFLRRTPTFRLLALAVALAAIAAATAAIALAATAGGPTPPPKPLANAVHDALTAPPIEGVSARVQFTDNLIGESVLQGSDPLLSGASGRLWASADGRLRLELQADVTSGSAGDFQALLDKRRFEVYDPGSETVYRGELPERRRGETGDEGARDEPPSLSQVQAGIEEAMEYVDISGATPSDVAGQPAYTVRVSPKSHGGLVGGAELAWDSENGAPLRAAVYARGESDPVLELKATDVEFGPVSESVFEVTPPPGARVVNLGSPEGRPDEGTTQSGRPGGLESVQAQVSFRISAPPSLAGRPRDEVRLVSSGSDAGALVTYGRGLDGIGVLELPATEPPSTEGPGQGLQAPVVSIEGVGRAHELDTPLGTALWFRREGVQYALGGSVLPAVAREAAQGL